MLNRATNPVDLFYGDTPRISLRRMSNAPFRAASSIRFVMFCVATLVAPVAVIRAQDCQCHGPTHHCGKATSTSKNRVPTPVRNNPNAADWTAMASTYTHDAAGQRVDQFAEGVAPHSNERPDFVQSGFRSTRSSLQVGFTSDHYHTTEQWGGGVQPYGQWRYPYRPYSVPYGAWGPQLPQVVGGFGGWGGGVVPSGWGNPAWGMNPWQAGGANGNLNGNPNGNGNGAGANGNPAMPPNGQFNNGQQWGNVGPGGPGGPWNNPWNNWNNGPNNGPWNGPGNGGAGQFGVGPNNALRQDQDEYYQQAPMLRVPNEPFFHSPIRN